MTPGLFYCPYVPLQMVRAVGENSFQPKIEALRLVTVLLTTHSLKVLTKVWDVFTSTPTVTTDVLYQEPHVIHSLLRHYQRPEGSLFMLLINRVLLLQPTMAKPKDRVEKLRLDAVVGVLNSGALIGHSLRTPIQPNSSQLSTCRWILFLFCNCQSWWKLHCNYRGHDPTVLDSETYVDTSNGVFGIGGRTTTTRIVSMSPEHLVRLSLKRERTMRGPKSASRRKVEESQAVL